MSRQIIGLLMDRWINDPEFRKQLKKDSIATVTSMGVKLEEEELTVLKKIDWSLSDEELQKRVSNFFS